MLYQEEPEMADEQDKFQQLRERAEAGEAEAQFELAWKLGEEKTGNIPTDHIAERFWYERAAEQGHQGAMFNLACMFSNHEGGENDIPRALELYRRCGELGDREAFFDYGVLLEEQGRPVEQVIAAYRRAGTPEAWFNLALLYDYGRGVPVDHRRAVRYYRRAADAGHIEAACNLGASYHHGTGVRKDEHKAFFYIRFAAENGDELAYCGLAESYYFGEGTRKNYRKAFEWFRRSYLQSRRAKAADWLGALYAEGKGVRRDLRKAFLWRKKAVASGDEPALFSLALMYIHGEGTEKKPDEARKLLERFLEHNPDDCDARYWLGMISPAAEALPHFDFVYRREHDPWSAWQIVRLGLKGECRFPPERFRELEKLLHLAVRKKIPGALRLLRSRRWQAEIRRKYMAETCM